MRPSISARWLDDPPVSPKHTDRASGLEEAMSGDRAAPMTELGLTQGTMIAGTYRIVRPLGAGGMGVVTLAHDEHLDRNVAIKFIRPELFAAEDLRNYFITEARAMARVSHPNVLTVHTFGEHSGIPYFVMEYVDGPTVEEWLAKSLMRGRTDVAEALRIFDQTCLGVSAIHEANTIHRDIKPSNLLIDKTLRVAVSDLGVARILEGAGGGQSCTVVGSAAYMAPEAALGDDTRPELATSRDVYALGCLAYELLSGRPPFLAPSDMGLMAKHLLETPQPISCLREDLRLDYDDVLLRALEKDPHRRWPTVEALRSAVLAVRERALEPRHLLIVDDDDDWRSLIERALHARFPSAAIDVVGDGDEAMNMIDRRKRDGLDPYCAVLLDLEMPAVGGMELTRWLRASDSFGPTTPIIVMTAAGGPGEWRRLSNMGADAFLVKPVDPEDVALLIRRTIRSRNGMK